MPSRIMRIVFDASTLEQVSPVTGITGVVYFDFDGTLFPAERRSDFVVVIATWWVDAVQRLEQGNEDDVELFFMDGPFHVLATRLDRDQVTLRCVERDRTEIVHHEQVVARGVLRDQVRKLASDVAAACTRAGMRSTDLDELKKRLPN